jgi:hypothetical protein
MVRWAMLISSLAHGMTHTAFEPTFTFGEMKTTNTVRTNVSPAAFIARNTFYA